MKKLILLIILLALAPPLFAEEEIPVNIKADLLKYSEDSKIVTATGSVEVEFEEINIKADKLVMDTKTNIVTAEGNVKFDAKGYDANCSKITYFVSNESSFYEGFKSTIKPPKANGELFLKADSLEDLKKEMEGTEGKVTTCDYEHPHYHTAAKKIEYFPEDKIVGYFATFYILDAPVFWTPYVVYDLKNKEKRNWSIGRNDVEGNFIKTSWDYPYGQIYLDEMEKKGFGQGLTYNYKKDNQDGTLYLYHIEEADTHISDLVAKLNHNIGIDDNTKVGLALASTAIYAIPSGRYDQSSYSLSFNHADKRKVASTLNYFENRAGNQERLDFNLSHAIDSYNTNYSFNLDQSKLETGYVRVAQRITHSQNLFSDKTKLNFNAAYYRNIQSRGEYGNENIEPVVEITHQGPFYRMKFYENWRIDLDKDLYQGDESDQYLESQPEITVDFNPINLGFFSLSTALGYGYFHEVKYVPAIEKNRSFSTGRYKASLGTRKTLPVGFGTNFNLSLGLDQYAYDTGDAMNAFKEEYSLNSQGYNFVRNELKYSRGISDGNSPFFFDNYMTKYNNLRESLTFYHLDKFLWNNVVGYNYETQKYLNYETNMKISPDKSMIISFKSGFDIENQKYLDLSSNFKLIPIDKFSMDLGIVNDLNLGGVKQGSALFDLETGSTEDWGNHWNFKYGFVYDTVLQDFKVRDIMIKKDLHCWDVTYTYSDYRKESTLVFILKAFPGDPIGYSDNRGFYFEGFEKSMKEEFEQDSPRRY